jgi:hypothetical protein
LISQTNWINSNFNETAYSLQYAGSTGFMTFGINKITTNQKIEIGLQAGVIPSFIGNSQRSIVAKFLYAPFKINRKSILFQPITSGLFFARHYGESHGNSWSSKYPKGYYWWNRSLRSHIFIGTQLSINTKSNFISRISIYFEANTNDLYLYSYFPNIKSIKLYDIIFFGTGLKLYIK